MKILRPVDALCVQAARREGLSLDVYASLVGTLFDSFSGYMTLVVAGLVLTASAFTRVPDLVTASALTLMFGVATTRLILYSRYKAYKAATPRPQRRSEITGYELVFGLSGTIMAATIGVTEAYLTFKEPGVVSYSVSIVVTMGVAGAISGRNGSRPKILYVQVLAIVLPFITALYIEGTPGMNVVAGLIGIYIVATFLATRAFYRSLRASLEANYRNNRLNLKVERQAAMFDSALNNMTSGLFLLDKNERLIVANERTKEIFGRDLIEGAIHRDFVAVILSFSNLFGLRKRQADLFTTEFTRIIAEEAEHTIVLSDRVRHRVLEFRVRRIPGQGSVINVDDISEKRKKEEDIYRLAHQDTLTGLPNRLSLKDHLKDAIAACGSGLAIVAMFIDLDHFKEVNDAHGHSVGDALLIDVAKRIRASLRRGDYSARIAGDEFVVVFSDVADEQEIAQVAERIIAALSRPYTVERRSLEVSASAGMALTRDGNSSPDELLRAADVALYAAKTAGRNRLVWFDRKMDERARSRREMTIDLREAIETGQLRLFYQPIVDFRAGRVVCCEALTRWAHPHWGQVPPSTFIGLAEESDLIHRLGVWSLRQACLDAKTWTPAVAVAVNVSPVQFKHASISKTISEILHETGLEPQRLEVEVTEGALAEDFDGMKEEMMILSRLGVSIVLDDFGTGYSSLSMLHELPIDKVKLDRSFIRRLKSDPDAITLIKSIVQMTRTMRKEIVVEGVETVEELASVAEAQARIVQGYHFSHPVPGTQIEQTMRALEERTATVEKLVSVR